MTSGPLMLDLAGPTLADDEADLLAHPLVGGVILFGRNYRDRAQLIALTGAIRARRPDLLIAVDYEGGRVQRFRDGFTRLPPMQRIGADFATAPEMALATAEAAGWLIGSELHAVGVDLPLAPVLDLDRGRAAVIGDRAFHHDADTLIALARAWCAGLNAAGLCATGKHYPGHAGVTADSHETLPVDARPETELAADEAPFAALIGAGLESVMMAHIRYPAVDALPASLSPVWIRERLRQDLGFAGAVFCDDLNMAGAAAAGDFPARARAALAAGCDILPVCNNRAAVLALLDALTPVDDAAAAARRARLRARPATKTGVDRSQALARLAALNTCNRET